MTPVEVMSSTFTANPPGGGGGGVPPFGPVVKQPYHPPNNGTTNRMAITSFRWFERVLILSSSLSQPGPRAGSGECGKHRMSAFLRKMERLEFCSERRTGNKKAPAEAGASTSFGF